MNWRSATLDSLCSRVFSGGTPSTTNDAYYGGDIPWLRTQEVTFCSVFDTEIKITGAGLRNSSAKWVPEKSVIVAMYGNSAGRSAINEIPLTTNQACCNLVIDPDKADYRYVFYALLRNYEALKGLSRGAAQNNLNAAQVKAFEIPAPSVQVQRSIGDILSAYDDLIENNRRRMALLEDSARLLYREWFIRLRFPGHEHIRITDGVPNGWQWRMLESVCSNGNGIQTGPFGSQLHQADYSDEGVPVVMPKDLINFRVSVESIARIPESFADSLWRHRMVPGDTVYGRRGDIGRRAYIGQRQAGWFCGTGCLRIRPDALAINSRYLFDALGAPETAGVIANRAKGSTMLNLSASALKSVPVLVASRTLQDIYAEHVETTRGMVEVLEEENQKLRAARDLLLPRLMSGEVVV